MRSYVFYHSWNNAETTQAAIKLQYEGKYEAALKSYCKALEIDPSDHVIWYDQGALLANLKRYEEAIVSYDKAISLELNQSSRESDTIYHAWTGKGYALSCLRHYDEAFTSLDKAIELKPNNSLAWEDRSNLLQRLGRHEDALTSIDKALEVGCYPYTEFLVWEQRATLCNHLKRFDDEAESYEQAIERYEWVGYDAAPYLPVDYNFVSYLFSIWQHRGVALIKAKRYEDAIDSFDYALVIYQPNKELCSSQPADRFELYYFWRWRSVVLNRLHRYDEARISLEQAEAVGKSVLH